MFQCFGTLEPYKPRIHMQSSENVKHAKELIKAGYEYVCDIDNLRFFRKRKL